MTSAKMPPNTRPIMIAIFVDFVLDIDDGTCKNGFLGRYLESLTNIICQMPFFTLGTNSYITIFLQKLCVTIGMFDFKKLT
jgi:hypothetical protein